MVELIRHHFAFELPVPLPPQDAQDIPGREAQRAVLQESKDTGVEVDKPMIAYGRRGDRFCESVAGILDPGGRPLAWLGNHAMPCRVDVTETVTHAVRQRATGRDLPQRSPRPREGASL